MDEVRELLWSAFNRKVFAHDIQTGFEVWEYPMRSGGMSTALVVDGQLLFAASNGYIYALEAQTGREVWTNSMKGKGLGTTYIALSRQRPESHDDPLHKLVDLIWVAFGGRVFALWRLNGEIVWEYKLGEGMGFFTNAQFPSIMIEHDLLVIAVNGYFYALDAMTGALRWTNPMSGKGVGVTALAKIHAADV